MKKLILAVMLLFVLSIGFSDAISDFVKSNLNFVIAAFVFILIFGISMGTAGIWVEKPGEIVGIALGISALISVLVLLICQIIIQPIQLMLIYPLRVWARSIIKSFQCLLELICITYYIIRVL